jgi:hypothetical protein
MIQELSVKFAIKECCQALGVSRSGYYQWLEREPSQREKEDAELLKQIEDSGLIYLIDPPGGAPIRACLKSLMPERGG